MTRKEVLNKFRQIDVEEMVTEVMIQDLGIPAHLKGYGYTRDAIVMAIYDQETVSSVTKLLYPEVAKLHKTTDQKVERAIRNAIEVSWQRANPDSAKKLFGYNDGTRPSNSMYISAVADAIYMKMRKHAAA